MVKLLMPWSSIQTIKLQWTKQSKSDSAIKMKCKKKQDNGIYSQNCI
jgi:hypothetical protein